MFFTTTNYTTLNDSYVSNAVMGEPDKYNLIGFSIEAGYGDD